ncbi:YhcB family protein [Cellvibrio polysaccharolyticus]|uniref:Z-ring associated protein G n=1 Tax=Cellvibrio polysaccharolyticus TaxID=2082724 RepID=A0A928V2Z6_9GAMM|nr:DUF1043 family protein [Cellvibrio polysaccharolyticus]MBE8716853.1 DUF1043 family protein [Cellvibrio polysaccharolyticus]
MVSFSTLIVACLISLIVGGGLGAFLLYLFRAQVYSQELEQRLHDAEGTLQSYQRDVAEHFAQTSQLVNNLTQSYRDVHEHLANSALKLATPAISKQILDSANGNLLGGEKSYINEQQFEAPRDWAPKTAGSSGTLSEEYGLHDYHHDDKDIDQIKAPAADGVAEYDPDDTKYKS